MQRGRPAAAAALLALLALSAACGAAAVAPPSMSSSLRLPSDSDAAAIGSSSDSGSWLFDGPLDGEAADGSSAEWASSSGSSTAPKAVRLAVGDSDDEMVVVWSTQAATDQACVQLYAAPPAPEDDGGGNGSRRGNGGAVGSGLGSSGRVSVGGTEPEPPPAVQTVCGSSAPFVEPATGEASQQLSTVVLRDLAPGQQYRYRCGSDGGGWSAWRAFRAKRSTGQVSSAEPVSRGLVGLALLGALAMTEQHALASCFRMACTFAEQPAALP